MSDIIEQNLNITEAVNDNAAPKWELDKHFETEVQKQPIIKQLKTSVSKLAIIAPSIFMSNSDAEKMIQMLYETREDTQEILKEAA